MNSNIEGINKLSSINPNKTVPIIKDDEFYEMTHNNKYLDNKTELLVGLSAAIAMNCQPCTKYYLLNAKKAGIKNGEISEVIAKVMAVAAGQKNYKYWKF